MDRYKLDLVTAGRNFNKIRMAIASGFFFHAARKDAQVCFRSLNAPAPPPGCTPRQHHLLHPQSQPPQVFMISHIRSYCSVRMLS